MPDFLNDPATTLTALWVGGLIAIVYRNAKRRFDRIEERLDLITSILGIHDEKAWKNARLAQQHPHGLPDKDDDQ